MGDANSRRFDVDPFRGWVCLSILVMHFYFSTVGPQLHELVNSHVIWAVSNLRLGVESFFLLAGFFLAHSFRRSTGEFLSARNFLQRRFIRLLVPYWVVLVLAYANSWLPNILLDHHNPLPSPLEFIAMMFCVQNLFGVSEMTFTHWSMTVLLQFYFLWACLFWAVRRLVISWKVRDYHQRTETIMEWCLWLLTVFALIGGYDENQLLGKMLQHLPHFTMGLILYRIAMTGRGWIFWLTIAVGNLCKNDFSTGSREIAAIISSMILLWIARGGRFPDLRVTRILAYFGTRSYSIYLTHATVGYRVLNLSNHLPYNPWTAIGLFVVAIAVSLLTAVIFYHLIEEPLSRRVQSIEYRR